jgi:hypothetical protein
MTREEIDLREQIANEISALIDKSDDPVYQGGLGRAIGVVRSPIWHGQACPCTKCDYFKKPDCFVFECKNPAHGKFFGRDLCEYHLSLAKH